MGEATWEEGGFHDGNFLSLLHPVHLLCPEVESPTNESSAFARYLGIMAVGKALGAEFSIVYSYLLSFMSPCSMIEKLGLICQTEVSESGK